MADERQPAKLVRTVEPAIALAADQCRQQADLLIVADGRNLDAAVAGGGRDRGAALNRAYES